MAADGESSGATDETSDSHRITRTLQTQSVYSSAFCRQCKPPRRLQRSMPVSFEITLIDLIPTLRPSARRLNAG